MTFALLFSWPIKFFANKNKQTNQQNRNVFYLFSFVHFFSSFNWLFSLFFRILIETAVTWSIYTSFEFKQANERMRERHCAMWRTIAILWWHFYLGPFPFTHSAIVWNFIGLYFRVFVYCANCIGISKVLLGIQHLEQFENIKTIHTCMYTWVVVSLIIAYLRVLTKTTQN